MSDSDSSRFSLVGLVVALVTVGVGAWLGLRFVPVVGTYVGMLAGGLVAGLAIEHRPTIESGVAAALAGLGVLVAGTLPGNGVVEAVLALGSMNPVTLLVGVALSFAVGAFGGHFGDDLRDGLTEPLPESTPSPSGTTHARSTTQTDSVAVDEDRADAESTGTTADGTAAAAEDTAAAADDTGTAADATETGTDPTADRSEEHDDVEYELE